MTSDAVLVVQSLFTTIWSLFTSWHIPGTQTSPAEWALFVLFAFFIVRVLKRLFFKDDTG